MKHQVDFLELLQIDYERYPVIAVVGGGGKTSLIYRLTDELLDRDKRVIITTTTHMTGESELPFVRGGDAARVKEMLDREGYVIAAEYEEETGKYAALSEKKMEELKGLCDVMLVEADGAKHHPVKVPEAWEPVIPACADIVISVIGLDCLGQPISQSAYRMERTSEFNFLSHNCLLLFLVQHDSDVAHSLFDSVSSTLCSRFYSLHNRSLRCVALLHIQVLCVHSVVVLSVCDCRF